MSEYYGFIQEIKGVKGAVIESFLHFFQVLKKRKKERKREKQKGQAAICCNAPSLWNRFTAPRTDCGAAMLVNECLWQGTGIMSLSHEYIYVRTHICICVYVHMHIC